MDITVWGRYLYLSVIFSSSPSAQRGRRWEKSTTISRFTGTAMSAPNSPIVTVNDVILRGPIFRSGCSAAICSSEVLSYVNSRMLANIVVNSTDRTHVSRSVREKGTCGCLVTIENHKWPSERLLCACRLKVCPNSFSWSTLATGMLRSICRRYDSNSDSALIFVNYHTVRDWLRVTEYVYIRMLYYRIECKYSYPLIRMYDREPIAANETISGIVLQISNENGVQIPIGIFAWIVMPHAATTIEKNN